MAVTDRRILLTGATGFVGRHLFPALVGSGYEVRCTSRHPDRARATRPECDWVYLDVDRPESLGPALAGCDVAYYLLHGMAGGGTGDYEAREASAARGFAQAAGEAGLHRIIYVGGVAPEGAPSRHLRSRLNVGRILRQGPVPTVELRAAMIIGPGSESWRITRDLAARLPAMILPRWLESRSQPVAIRDMVAALLYALDLPAVDAVYAVPGPEILTAREMLSRTARLMGMKPLMVGVPLLTPRLSSYWIQLVTRADSGLSQELVEGLKSDLVAPDDGIWALLPRYERMGFDEAAREALSAEEKDLPAGTRAVESLIRALSPKPRRKPAPEPRA